MSIVCFAVFLWFGVWEGLIEPALPNHAFLMEDLYQLIIGAVFGAIAYRLEIPSAESDRDDIGQKIGEVEEIAFVILSFSISWCFMLPILENFDSRVFPYVGFVLRLTAETSFHHEADGILSAVGTTLNIFAFLAPFIVSCIKSFLLMVASVAALGFFVRPSYRNQSGVNVESGDRSSYVFLSHLGVFVIYLFFFY